MEKICKKLIYIIMPPSENLICTPKVRHFWCRGYYVDTVGRNKKAIEQYIRSQLQEDHEQEQLSLKEYIDPFTGKPTEEDK